VKGPDTGIKLTLVDAKEWTASDGRKHRREQWSISGGKIAASWKPKSGEPSSRFTLYVVDGEVDPRLAGYGGDVWPTAWAELFESCGQGYQRSVEITDLGLQFRAAALDGASDIYADVRLM
jgi:hypothetical protein